MKKEARQAFAARVTQASQSELTVILYDIILEEMNEAEECVDAGDLAGFDKELKQAQRYVNELMATLKYEYAISYDLLSLYMYVNKSLITAIMKRSKSPLSTAKNVIAKLQKGFTEVSKQDKRGPVMRNTQHLYAGLTYGKGRLNETYIDSNIHNRGFIA